MFSVYCVQGVWVQGGRGKLTYLSLSLHRVSFISRGLAPSSHSFAPPPPPPRKFEVDIMNT